jgi:hypothetical protein
MQNGQLAGAFRSHGCKLSKAANPFPSTRMRPFSSRGLEAINDAVTQSPLPGWLKDLIDNLHLEKTYSLASLEKLFNKHKQAIEMLM